MQRQWTSEKWQEEIAYIRSVDPDNPGKSYCYSRGTFETYCKMQANFAIEAGLRDIADEIASCHGFTWKQTLMYS